MAKIALLSNPHSTGNRAILPEVRSYCAHNDDVFHYEVDDVDQIAKALSTIAQVDPKVLVINGGDGTVQAALTELYQGGHFAGDLPPVAVLPNGKTNLIALDLGAEGSPLKALDRILSMVVSGDLQSHIVDRELIALSDGKKNGPVVLGMFLGGAGLSEFILYCRNKIYPLGLPNALSHVITAAAAILTLIIGNRPSFLPNRPSPVKVSMIRDGELQGTYAVLIVTTLEKLLLMGKHDKNGRDAGRMRFMAIDQKFSALMKFAFTALIGRLGEKPQSGIHLQQGDSIRIEGEHSSVVMDGELFHAEKGKPIVLKSTEPVAFLRLAA